MKGPAWVSLAVFLTGCSPLPGTALEVIPPDVERWLGGCRKYSGHDQDWCVVQALAGMPDPTVITAAERVDLCRSLIDGDAADSCLEQTVSLDERVAPSVCVHVQRERMRASCRLAGVDRLLKTDVSLKEALEACRHTGVLEQHCLVHLVRNRSAAWTTAGYPTAMAAVGQLVHEVHGTDGMDSLGAAVGELAALLGAMPEDGPCEFFRKGRAYTACRQRQHSLAGRSRAAP